MGNFHLCKDWRCLGSTLTSRLPTAIRGAFGPGSPVTAEGCWGEWRETVGAITAKAPGTSGYAFLDLKRADLLLETEIEMNAGTHSAGFLLEADDALSSGYALSIEPLRSQVVFKRWPQPMDPLWQRLAPGEIGEPTVDNPLGARHLPDLAIGQSLRRPTAPKGQHAGVLCRRSGRAHFPHL